MATLVAFCLGGGASAAGAVEIVVGGHAGYGSYTQEDLNAAIRQIDSADEIKAGGELGGEVGVRLNASAVLGVAYGRLFARTEGAAEGRSWDISVPADCWVAFLNWLPDNDKVGRIGLGADAGVVTTRGTAEVIQPDGQIERTQYAGDGLFLAGYVIGDVALGGRLSLYAHGGFRLANVTGVDVDGVASTYNLDYSGAFARVGLRYSLGGDPR